MLVLRDRVAGRRITAGRADPFVRPVWSVRQTSILFVRVRPTARYPGAHWTLWRYDLASRHARPLTSANAMQIAPLGWQGNSVLLSIARESTTGYYLLRKGTPVFQAILWAQPITNPALSPDGRFITFVSPSDCVWCPVIIFDRQTNVGWYGPSGVPDEYTMAWAIGGDTVVVRSWQYLLAINATSHAERRFALPAGLPVRWADPMAARISGSSIVLQDQRTGRRFTAPPAG